MYMETNVTEDKVESQISQSDKQERKIPIHSYSLIIVLVALSFVVGGLAGYLLGVQKSSSVTSKVDVKQGTSGETKTYVNDFYHISFEIPQNWEVQEYTKDDGRPAFKISSADDQISIESPLPDLRQEGSGVSLKSSNHAKQDLDQTTVQLGEHSIPRSRYINDFDEVQDYISLYNIPFQKVVNLFFTVKGDYESNNQKLLAVLKTFEFTQQEPSLETMINFQLGEGWGKQEQNPANETDDDSLSFVSPDFEPNIGMGINTGAMLRVSRHLKDPRKTMYEIVEQGLPLPLKNEANQAQTVTIGSEQGLNLFTCWEGCYDGYYIEDEDYYWIITFSCADSCSTKAEMNASKFVTDRDTFLNSFSFR